MQTVQIPQKLEPVLRPPRGALRYRCAYGGRGGGKSFSFALWAAILGAAEPLRILCCREFQASIRDSFYAEVKSAIRSSPQLDAVYDIGVDYIRGHNGTEFLFRGLRHNISSIKSMAHIDICIVEEAEDVPEESWIGLLPTIRDDKSEVWVMWNPKRVGSPVDLRFRENTPPRCAIVDINYYDNPFLPATLDEERRNDLQRLDKNVYENIWLGKYLKFSAAQIFHDKIVVQEFKPIPRVWGGPYQGLDYGFSVDPMAAVRDWVHNGDLYIEYEAGGVGIELDHTAHVVTSIIPEFAEYTTRADSASPQSTSYLSRNGLPRIESVRKWPGSIVDGIRHIRSYGRIIVDPRCIETIREGELYSYRTDRHTGEIIPDPIDAHNHYWDAHRYALEPLIGGGVITDYRDVV